MKTLVFNSSFFDFGAFLRDFAENLVEKPDVFKTDIKSSCKFLLFDKDLRSRNFSLRNDGPLNNFRKLEWKRHFIGNFCQNHEISDLLFNWNAEFPLHYCCVLKNKFLKVLGLDLDFK